MKNNYLKTNPDLYSTILFGVTLAGLTAVAYEILAAGSGMHGEPNFYVIGGGAGVALVAGITDYIRHGLILIKKKYAKNPKLEEMCI